LRQMESRSFTFLEIIVVAAIMVLVAVIAIPQVSKMPRRLEAEGALSNIRQAVREVGMRARATGTPLLLVLDEEAGQFNVEPLSDNLSKWQDWQPPVKKSDEAVAASVVALQSKDSYPISGGVEWLPAETGLDQYDSVSFAFFEDGQAAGKPLRFRVGGRYYQMDVDCLTGAPLIEELE